MTLGVTLILRTPTAQAATGNDGLIAMATVNGIEVFDPAGDGSDMHVLIPNSDHGALNPAWSPLGDFIAYDDGSTVWVARSDGTHEHKVSGPGDSFAEGPAWSPDGRLAFYTYGTIVIVDPNGTHRTEIVPADQLGRPRLSIDGRPVWTADGRLVVPLIEYGAMARSAFIADGDGGHLRPLTRPDGSRPSWFSESWNWQFSSTGLAASWFQADSSSYWVGFTTFDGRYLVPDAGDAGADLNGGDDVALSPSGQRAVVVGPIQSYPYATSVHIWNVDLTSSTEQVQMTGSFEAPGPSKWPAAGLDWQPRCSITGTEGDDELTGGPGPDLICGLGGNDVISGVGGNDVIYGGAGSDMISGGSGNDVLVGGSDTDGLRGGRGRDLMNSRRDAKTSDTVDGGRGHNVCINDTNDALTSC
jgi:hypothetical protein